MRIQPKAPSRPSACDTRVSTVILGQPRPVILSADGQRIDFSLGTTGPFEAGLLPDLRQRFQPSPSVGVHCLKHFTCSGESIRVAVLL